jgi:XTP/dITP diphosphohydrolase
MKRMTRLYAATSNPGKLRDFSVAAEASEIAIEPMPGLKEIPAPPEDEPDFVGNARAKAIYYSRFALGELVIADDSGLEVDALNGKPGVRSARFADDAGFLTDQPLETDERNNLYLLTRLENVPTSERRARYRCVLAAARDGVCLITGEGSVEGEILTLPRGEGGFGYDPLFYLPALGKTMAEIDLVTKHTISHRGLALRGLLKSEQYQKTLRSFLDGRRSTNQ